MPGTCTRGYHTIPCDRSIRIIQQSVREFVPVLFTQGHITTAYPSRGVYYTQEILVQTHLAYESCMNVRV